VTEPRPVVPHGPRHHRQLVLEGVGVVHVVTRRNVRVAGSEPTRMAKFETGGRLGLSLSGRDRVVMGLAWVGLELGSGWARVGLGSVPEFFGIGSGSGRTRVFALGVGLCT
jgi:hypothetical protein